MDAAGVHCDDQEHCDGTLPCVGSGGEECDREAHFREKVHTESVCTIPENVHHNIFLRDTLGDCSYARYSVARRDIRHGEVYGLVVVVCVRAYINQLSSRCQPIFLNKLLTLRSGFF